MCKNVFLYSVAMGMPHTISLLYFDFDTKQYHKIMPHTQVILPKPHD